MLNDGVTWVLLSLFFYERSFGFLLGSPKSSIKVSLVLPSFVERRVELNDAEETKTEFYRVLPSFVLRNFKRFSS